MYVTPEQLEQLPLDQRQRLMEFVLHRAKLMQEEDIDEIIYFTVVGGFKSYLLLPGHYVHSYMQALPQDLLVTLVQRDPYEKFQRQAAKFHYQLRSFREAERLGYDSQGYTYRDQYRHVAFIEHVQGREAGHDLIEQHGFSLEAQIDPLGDWDVLQWRRDEHAIIAIVGDNSGPEDDWHYYLIVCWDLPQYESHWTSQGMSPVRPIQ